MDRSRMGGVGARPTREILPAHDHGTQAVGRRDARLGAHVERDRPRPQAGVDRMGVRDLKLRLRGLITPSRVERDLHDELSFHIEREARKLVDQGMPPDEARAMAQAGFGSTAVVADQCRDERGTAFVDNAIRDVQFALRSFRRAPLAAFTIVATVAIGLGVVAVLFTILNMFLFRVDTVPDISEMYAVERLRLANGDRWLFTRQQFGALRRETSVFTDAYAAVPDIDLRVDGRTMAVTLVTGNFFRVVGVTPVMGRALAPADDESGGNRVIVLSDKGWDRRFDRDPNVLGRTVLVGGAPFEIIGVMPAGFRGLEFSAPDLWARRSAPAGHRRLQVRLARVLRRVRHSHSARPIVHCGGARRRARGRDRLGINRAGAVAEWQRRRRNVPARTGSRIRRAAERRTTDAGARGHGGGRVAGRRGLSVHRHQGCRHPPADQRQRAEDVGRGASAAIPISPAAPSSIASPGSLRTWA
jgi:hypothetical protein